MAVAPLVVREFNRLVDRYIAKLEKSMADLAG
jgi:hypothetical protein